MAAAALSFETGKLGVNQVLAQKAGGAAAAAAPDRLGLRQPLREVPVASARLPFRESRACAPR